MTSRHLLFALCASLFAYTVTAQPQWRFHLAFENGDGARDTIWLVYDTTATLGSPEDQLVDTALGEGRIELDPDEFNVWTYNWAYDTTKTVARPYSVYPNHNVPIDALNWQLPITIRWNRALFEAPYLPVEQGIFGEARMDGGYFFLVNNDPPLQAFNMLLDDSVHVPNGFPGDYLFSFGVLLSPDSDIGIPSNGDAPRALIIDENPVQLNCVIRCAEIMEDLVMRDMNGRQVYRKSLGTREVSVELGFLQAGVYLVSVTTNSNHHYNERLIKVD